MKLLIDTCTLLWLAADQTKLTEKAIRLIRSNPDELFVSAISAFEIGLKHRKRKLDLGMEPEAWWQRAVAQHGLRVMPITDSIALASTALPPLHADPCDRMIIATSIAAAATIVTPDPAITQYPNVMSEWW